MASIALQVFNDVRSSFLQRIKLNGTIYNLKIYWNTRESTWYMDILDQDLEYLLMGLKLVPNFPLLQEYDRSFIDYGNFILVDTSGFATGDRPTFENLGTRYQLIFVEGNE